MRFQDFQVIKCSSHIHVPFSSQWSEDGFVAMTTDKGVYITELKPKSFTKTPALDMLRSAVTPSQVNPTANNDIDILELAKLLGENDLYSLVQDVTMSPNIRSEEFKPTAKFANWSPVICPFELRSILTILTDSGALDLYMNYRDEWVNVGSISDMWVKICKSTWDPNQQLANPKDGIDTLRSRTYKIKITAYCWGGIHCNRNHTLFTASKDGTIVVWEIIREPNSRLIDIKMLGSYETHSKEITSLTYTKLDDSKFILFYATIDGKIQSIILTLSDLVIMAEVTKKEHQTEYVTFEECVAIWKDEDKIKVNNGAMLISKNESNQINLIVAKGLYLIIFTVNNDGSSSNYDVTPTEDIAITGIELLSPEELLIVSRSGVINLIKFKQTDNQFLKTVEQVECPFKNDAYACHGIALSKNKVMAYIAFTIKASYDHLQIREYSQAYWCFLPGLKEAMPLVKQLKEEFGDLWDAFEIIRIQHQKKIKILEIDDTKKLDTLNLKELKRNLCFSNILLTNDSLNPEQRGELIRFKEIVVILIKLYSAERWVKSIFEKTEYSEFEINSLNRIMEWLTNVMHDIDDKYSESISKARNILDLIKLKQIPTIKEICFICNDSVPVFTGHFSAVCRSSHTIPRCSLSFVQCTDLVHYKCELCSLLVHYDAVQKERRCVMCDSYLTMNDLILRNEELILI